MQSTNNHIYTFVVWLVNYSLVFAAVPCPVRAARAEGGGGLQSSLEDACCNPLSSFATHTKTGGKDTREHSVLNNCLSICTPFTSYFPSHCLICSPRFLTRRPARLPKWLVANRDKFTCCVRQLHSASILTQRRVRMLAGEC